MKKLFFIAAMAGAALVGCTKNEVDFSAGDQKITFDSPVVATATKANVFGEIGANYDTDESFNVYAVWHQESFDKWEGAKKYMDKVTVSYNSTVDDTTPGSGAWKTVGGDYYWPKVGVLTFAAYSPADAEGTFSYGKDGLKINGFSIPATTDKQFDLMYSERTYNKTQSEDGTNTTYDGVDIKFKHALSSIKFTAKTKDNYSASTTIKVKGITMWGMKSRGNFAETVTDGTTYVSAPAWSGQSNNVTEANAYVAYNGELTLNPSAQNANSYDVILLPQKFLLSGPTIRVDYTMQTKTGEEIPQYKEVSIQSLSTEWKPGFRYTYHIIIGLDDIYFAPAVKPWEDATGSDLEI